MEEEEEEEEDLFVFNDTIESHFCAFGVGVTLLVVHLLCTYRQHISNTLATHWQHISNTLATHHISNTLATHHIGNTLATHHISNTLATHFLRCTPCFFRVNQASFFALGSPKNVAWVPRNAVLHRFFFVVLFFRAWVLTPDNFEPCLRIYLLFPFPTPFPLFCFPFFAEAWVRLG